MKRETLIKAANFCVYQDRTQAEVRKRLFDWGIESDNAEEIIVYLIEENFLNEERFSKIYAGSKFRVKQWGKQKIRHEMKAKGLSDYNIRTGLAEILDEDYEATIKDIIEKKANELRNEKQKALVKQKIFRFLLGKGFESNLIWSMIGKVLGK
jgi:regulatory protein